MSFRFRVSMHHNGRRLDKVLRGMWPDLPLGALMKNIRKGLVRVEGRKASCSMKILEGQEIYVPWEPPVVEEIQGVMKELDTVYRNDGMWIVNKPSDLLSQPSRKGEDSVLTRSWADASLVGTDFRPALVNRLDRNTSGLVMVALNGEALRNLQEAIRNRMIRKLYLAVVCGRVPDEGKIEFPLLKDSSDNTVKVDELGRPSTTLFKRLYSDDRFSMVELELVTGRSHQARVHMAHLGYPILGDMKYGNEEENNYWFRRGIKRPLLHAHKLIFSDMDSYTSLHSPEVLQAPVPVDMKDFFRKKGWKVDAVK